MSGWPMFDFSSAPPFQQIMDLDGGDQVVYIGWATPGVLTSDPKWKIRKLTYTTDSNGNRQVTRIQYANGDVGFNAVWASGGGVFYTGPVSGPAVFK